MSNMRQWENVWVTLLAGGRGSRFWPWSQSDEPKQFLSIPPISSSQSLLQATVARILPTVPAQRIVVVGLQEHQHLLQQQLPMLPRENILLEPVARNTAASIVLAAEWIACRDSANARQWVLPADHHIGDATHLLQAVVAGLKFLERRGALLTFGVAPRWAEIGYGYIERGESLGKMDDLELYQAKSFREKPTLSKAQSYVASQQFYWNSGMFLWPIAVLREELLEHQAALYSGVQKIVGELNAKPSAIKKTAYEHLPAVSIDVGLMELSKRVCVVATPLEWSDLGGWESIYQLLPKDGDGNVVVADESLVSETNNSLLHCPGLQIIATGIDNLVVAYHDGRLLICRRDQVSGIRPLVEQLTGKGKR